MAIGSFIVGLSYLLLAAVGLAVTVFRGSYEQVGNTVALWADSGVDRRAGGFCEQAGGGGLGVTRVASGKSLRFIASPYTRGR